MQLPCCAPSLSLSEKLKSQRISVIQLTKPRSWKEREGREKDRHVEQEKVEGTTIGVGHLLLTQLRENAFGEMERRGCKPVQKCVLTRNKEFSRMGGGE